MQYDTFIIIIFIFFPRHLIIPRYFVGPGVVG